MLARYVGSTWYLYIYNASLQSIATKHTQSLVQHMLGLHFSGMAGAAERWLGEVNKQKAANTEHGHVKQ